MLREALLWLVTGQTRSAATRLEGQRGACPRWSEQHSSGHRAHFRKRRRFSVAGARGDVGSGRMRRRKGRAHSGTPIHPPSKVSSFPEFQDVYHVYVDVLQRSLNANYAIGCTFFPFSFQQHILPFCILALASALPSKPRRGVWSIWPVFTAPRAHA